jgi:hypothetical protein
MVALSFGDVTSCLKCLLAVEMAIFAIIENLENGYNYRMASANQEMRMEH